MGYMLTQNKTAIHHAHRGHTLTSYELTQYKAAIHHAPLGYELTQYKTATCHTLTQYTDCYMPRSHLKSILLQITPQPHATVYQAVTTTLLIVL